MTSFDPIPPAVLKRKAVVYVRQSSQSQVLTKLARHERQTAEQSSTQHSQHASQRRQADIMPNLDRCPVRQRDLYLAVRHLFRSPRRRHLDRPRALAVRSFPESSVLERIPEAIPA
jgi:hypothetical protein